MRTHGGVARNPKSWVEPWQFTEAWPPMAQAIQHANGTDVQDEVPLLFALACELEPKVIVELGTRQGTSTRTLWAAAQLLDAQFFTVDPEPSCEGYIRDILHPKYCQFLRMTGQHAFHAGVTPPGTDFLFIDTDPHTYEQTIEWLETWIRVSLVSGGCATFHDTVPARPEMEVARAVREWVAKNPGYLWNEIPTTYGLGVLWKP